jgi:hypothetical protein
MGNLKTKDMTNVTFFAADRRQFLVPKKAVKIFAKTYNENVSGPYNPAALRETAKRFNARKAEVSEARKQLGACISALRTQGWQPRDITDVTDLGASEQRGLRTSAANGGAVCDPDKAAQKIGELANKYYEALDNMLEASYARRAAVAAVYYNTDVPVETINKDSGIKNNSFVFWIVRSVGGSPNRNRVE